MSDKNERQDQHGPETMCGMYLNPFNRTVDLMESYLSKHGEMFFVKGHVIFTESISKGDLNARSIAEMFFERVVERLKDHSPALAWARDVSGSANYVRYNFYVLLTEERDSEGYYIAGLFKAYDDLRDGLESLNPVNQGIGKGLGVELEQLYTVDDKSKLDWCCDWVKELYFVDPTRSGAFNRSEFGFNRFGG